MGTICAPIYANNFMADFKRKHIHPFNNNISLLYLQYINDIFMIRKGGENHVKVFLKQLNEQQSAINFDYKI